MTPRQKSILKKLTVTHLKTGKAVGSKILSRFLNLSSATIRLELKMLVDDGYLETVHGFVGRIPSDKGWEYFVNELAHESMIFSHQLKIKNRREKEIFDLLSTISRHLRLLTVSFFEDFTPQLFSAGFASLFRNREFNERFMTEKFLNDIEILEKNIPDAFQLLKKEPIRILIGKDNPLLPSGLFSSALCGDEDARWIISLTGPKRMPYQQTLSFLQEISKLLSNK